MLWHQSLGHIDEKVLQDLKTKSLVDRLNDCDLEFYFCEHSIYRQHNHAQFLF